MIRRVIRYAAIGFVLLLAAIQFVPVWGRQTNPPVLAEPAWASPEARAAARRACYDCHSNETTWPLYGRVAPASWLVTYDVLEGRKQLNFSEWGLPGAGRQARRNSEPGELAEEIREVLAEGEMPPRAYLLLHPEARLTAAEQQLLVDSFQN